MPFNIFGEQWEDNCACTACQRIIANRDYVDGFAYYGPDEARRARMEWRAARGEYPQSRYTPGTSQHVESMQLPETIRLAAIEDSRWTVVHLDGEPWDEGTIREFTLMMDAPRHGLRWGAYRSQPELTPAQRLLSSYPRTDPRKNYSWRPSRWVMNGTGPSFYGMEIEIQCRDSRVMHHVQNTIGKTGHLKNDSSIGGGFELVTHPMSYDWAMEHFPWALLPELAEMGCTVDAANNGIHVHVNRAGFASSAHMLRWLKFIYRNRSQVTRIARRETTRYGSFTEEVRGAHLAHVLAEKARARLKAAERRYAAYATYENELAYAEANRDLQTLVAGDRTRVNRYQAINTRGPDTLEMRMFASTLSVLEAQAALQMAACSVEYTRGIRAAEVCKGAWSWVAFSSWLRDRQPEYGALYQANRFARMPASPSATYVMSATPRRGL